MPNAPLYFDYLLVCDGIHFMPLALLKGMHACETAKCGQYQLAIAFKETWQAQGLPAGSLQLYRRVDMSGNRKITIPFLRVVGKEEFAQCCFRDNRDSQCFIFQGGDDIVVPGHQNQLQTGTYYPVFKKLPFRIEIGMEQVAQKVQAPWIETCDTTVEQAEVSRDGLHGYSCPVLTEMGNFPKVQIAGKQQLPFLPEKYPGGVEVKMLSFYLQGMHHLDKSMTGITVLQRLWPGRTVSLFPH